MVLFLDRFSPALLDAPHSEARIGARLIADYPYYDYSFEDVVCLRQQQKSPLLLVYLCGSQNRQNVSELVQTQFVEVEG